MDSNVKFRAGNRHPPCVRGRTLESRPLQARVTSRQTSTAGDPRSISSGACNFQAGTQACLARYPKFESSSLQR
jgi:hypothetical protein